MLSTSMKKQSMLADGSGGTTPIHPAQNSVRRYEMPPSIENSRDGSESSGDESYSYDEDDKDEEIIREFVLLRMQVSNGEPGANPVGENKTQWQQANKCAECLHPFNTVRRKHHCRNCGGYEHRFCRVGGFHLTNLTSILSRIVCRKCSAHRCALAGFYRPIRVCTTCWSSIWDSSIKGASSVGDSEESLGHTI